MNPWPILAALLLLVATTVCGFFYGQHVGKQACKASAFVDVTASVKSANKTGAAIDGIAAASAVNTAAHLNTNRSATDESAERIRTVVVPGDCRRVDPAVVRELRGARDEANAAIGAGLRQGPAGSAAADP